MVGPLSALPIARRGIIAAKFILFVLVIGQANSQDGCSSFQAEYCNMRLDNILMLDSNVTSAADCQALCFQRDSCVRFSHFSAESSRCVLFKKCSQPVRTCSGCVSGPPYPRISSCQRQPLRNEQDVPRNSFAESGIKQPRCLSRTCFALCASCPQPGNPAQEDEYEEEEEEDRNKDEDEDYMDPYGEDEGFNSKDDEEEEGDDGFGNEDDDDEDNDINIDDGLLDEVFSELPGNNNNNNRRNQPRKAPKSNKKKKNSNNNNNNCPTCPQFNTGFYYCVMGGSSAAGPVSAVSLLNTGTYAIPRSPLVAPFPPAMTQGSGATFSTFTGRSLMTCTPGYPVTGLTPASTFGSFFTQTYVPGTCNNYDVNRRSWTSTGGKLTTVREGGSTLRIGSYLVSLGGVSASGYPVTSIDIFDTRRANFGWKQVPKWSYPAATRDSCSVVTRDANGAPEMMTIGGEGQENSVMKMVLGTGQWFSLPGMIYPRKQHACTKVNMNGRPGVVISGGLNPYQQNITAVEFFDLNSGSWVNLPNLDRARRGHVMTTIEGNLAVAGGTTTNGGGDTEFLNDVEVFDGRRWKRAAYGMGGARNGANLVKIPFSTFTG